jgi:hypothetical protein
VLAVLGADWVKPISRNAGPCEIRQEQLRFVSSRRLLAHFQVRSSKGGDSVDVFRENTRSLITFQFSTNKIETDLLRD